MSQPLPPREESWSRSLLEAAEVAVAGGVLIVGALKDAVAIAWKTRHHDRRKADRRHAQRRRIGPVIRVPLFRRH